MPEFVYHYSEDPSIERFVPHIPATNPAAGAHVWAIDAAHAPLYWFPRDCPRATVWARDAIERALLHERFGTTADRVHWMESAWVERFEAVRLYEYRLDAACFAPWSEAEGQWIADVELEPLAIAEVRSCRERHDRQGIDLRAVDDLWAAIDAVVDSGLSFSIVRARYARPRPTRDSA